jgi:hypothetical protein
MATKKIAPSGAKLRSITGVDVIPTFEESSLQPWGLSPAVSPDSSPVAVHSGCAVFASRAYSVSFSVAMNSTLCTTELIVRRDTNSGCASTGPSSGKVPSLPNLPELTLVGVSWVSPVYAPVRAMSLCHVGTSSEVLVDGAMVKLRSAVPVTEFTCPWKVTVEVAGCAVRTAVNVKVCGTPGVSAAVAGLIVTPWGRIGADTLTVPV